MIEKKVAAATVGSALVTVIVWLLGAVSDVSVPAEVAAALATVVTAAAGYLTSSSRRV
ncbi:MAG TPA: hypothetical protein VHJ17_02435 [Thermomonospora sp.]|nr:hypothetical protein [Thermomonospora sp.]